MGDGEQAVRILYRELHGLRRSARQGGRRKGCIAARAIERIVTTDRNRGGRAVEEEEAVRPAVDECRIRHVMERCGESIRIQREYGRSAQAVVGLRADTKDERA